MSYIIFQISRSGILFMFSQYLSASCPYSEHLRHNQTFLHSISRKVVQLLTLDVRDLGSWLFVMQSYKLFIFKSYFSWNPKDLVSWTFVLLFDPVTLGSYNLFCSGIPGISDLETFLQWDPLGYLWDQSWIFMFHFAVGSCGSWTLRCCFAVDHMDLGSWHFVLL